MEIQRRLEFTKERIEQYVSVIESQVAKKPQDYYILRKFSVIVEDNEKRCEPQVELSSEVLLKEKITSDDPYEISVDEKESVEESLEAISSCREQVLEATRKAAQKMMRSSTANEGL